MIPLALSARGVDVDQAGQEVLSLWHNGHQELIIRVRPFLQTVVDTESAETPDSSETLPPVSVAWVLTLPSSPLKYRLADKSVFRAAYQRGREIESTIRMQERKTHWSVGCSAADGDVRAGAANLEVAELVRIGPYDIVAVKALGLDALQELNEFLGKNGFPLEDADHLRWFVERNFTFLVIRITPESSSAELNKAFDLQPLQVSFKSEDLYYPSMFSARQGNFALSMMTITSKPLDATSFESLRNDKLKGHGLWRVNLWSDHALPEEISRAMSGLPDLAGQKRWFFNSVESPGFNTKDETGTPAIMKWKEDVAFSFTHDQSAILRTNGEDYSPGFFEIVASVPLFVWIIWLIFFGVPALVVFLMVRMIYRRLRLRRPA